MTRALPALLAMTLLVTSCSTGSSGSAPAGATDAATQGSTSTQARASTPPETKATDASQSTVSTTEAAAGPYDAFLDSTDGREGGDRESYP